MLCAIEEEGLRGAREDSAATERPVAHMAAMLKNVAAHCRIKKNIEPAFRGLATKKEAGLHHASFSFKLRTGNRDYLNL
jgi:hypothetical protein